MLEGVRDGVRGRVDVGVERVRTDLQRWPRRMLGVYSW